MSYYQDNDDNLAPQSELNTLEGKPVFWQNSSDSGTVTTKEVTKSSYSIRWAVIIGISTLSLFLLVFIAGLAISRINSSSKSASTTPPKTAGGNYTAMSIPLDNFAKTGQLQLNQNNQLIINGQLRLNNDVVLTPTTAPLNSQAGEIYYNKATNQPYYYNGTQYINLLGNGQAVSSIGGLNGNITLGPGLQVNGGQLSLTTQVPSPQVAVTSLQGQTGNVQLVSGTGINLSGTTIINTGVTGINGSTGKLTVGPGLSVSNNVIANTTNITSSSSNLTVTPDGIGNFQLSLTGFGSGAIVALGPAVAQLDNSTNPSLFINKTANGSFLDFQFNGADQFVVDKNGQITNGTIDYSHILNAPSSITGSGTANSIPLFNANQNLVNSIITQNIAGTTITVAGAVSLTAGLNTNGSSISTSNGNIALGSGNITTTGTIASGLINGQNISNNSIFNNTVTIQGTNALTLGTASTNTGSIIFNGSSTAGNITLQGPVNPNINNYALSIPAITSNATICTDNSVCGGYASSSGSANYVNIQGTTPGVSQLGNFNISGTGIAANFSGNGSALTSLQGANILAGTVGNLALANSSITINNGTNITGGNILALGSSITVGTVNNPVFSTSVTTPTLKSAAALSVVSGTTLTLGTTGANAIAVDTGGASSISIGQTNATGLTLGRTGIQASIPGGLTTNGSPIATANGSISLGSGNINTTGTIASGLINGQSISNSSNFTGTVTIQGTGALTLGSATTNTGAIIFNGSGTAGNLTLQGPASPNTNNYTLSIPAISANANICTDNSICAGYASSSGSGNYVNIQGSSPGVAQAGNFNITGTGIAANFLGNGSGLSALNATNISSGTLNNTRLSGLVTLQGNTFNGSSQLLQLDGAGNLPAISAINLTNLNVSNATAGTLNDARLDPTVTIQGNTFNGASELLQLTNVGYLPVVNASNLTNINATNISTGTINDARLSANVPLINGNNTFTGNNTFNNPITVNSIQPSTGLTVGSTSKSLLLQGSGTTNLTSTSSGFTTSIGFGGTPTSAVTYNFDTTVAGGIYQVCSTVGNCSGLGGSVSSSVGTNNVLSKFSAAHSLTNSNLTDNGTSLSVAENGSFQAVGNSTNAFQIQNAAGTSNLFVADTTNTRLAVAQATANYTLDVAGDINSTTGLRVGGNLVCTSSGCGSSSGSGFYIQNGTSQQANANFNIMSNLGTSVVGLFRGKSGGQSADLIQAQNAAGAIVAEITASGNVNIAGGNFFQVGGSQISSANLSNDANIAKLNGTGPQTFTGNNKFMGSFLLQPSSDSTTKFQIQNAAGTSNLFVADTTDSRIGINTSTPGYALDVNGSINIATGQQYLINGVPICGPALSCAPAAGSTYYVQNSTSQQANSNFNIKSANPSGIGGIIQGASGQTADLFEGISGGASTVFAINSLGSIAVGKATASYAVDATGDVNASTGLRVGGVLVCTSSGCSGTGGSFVQLQGTTPGIAQSGNLNITGTAIAAFLQGDGSSITNINGGNIQGATVANAALTNSSITISNGTNITGGNTVSLGGTLTVGTVANPTFATSVTTPSLKSAAALSVVSGTTLTLGTTGANAIAIDTGGASSITIGGGNAISTQIGRAGNQTNIPGGLTTNGALLDTSNGSVTLGSGNLTTTGTIASGQINGQTISNAANFTGTVTIQGTGALTLGAANSHTGVITLYGSGSGGSLIIQGPNNPSVNNYTLSIPAITAPANICTDNSICAGYSSSSANGNYIENQNAVAQAANFNINGSATAATFVGNGASLTSLNGGNIQGGTVANAALTNSSITISNGTNITGGNTVSLGGTLTVGTVANPTFSTSVTTPSILSATTLNVTSGTSLTIASNTTNTASFDSGTTGNVNIGTGANAKIVTVGTTTSNGSTVIQSNAVNQTLGNSGDSVSSTTNTATAFQVNNSAGSDLLNINTINTTNLLVDGGFEATLSGTNWSTDNGASGAPTVFQRITSPASNIYEGQGSLLITTQNVIGQGAKYVYPSMNPTTTYTLSFDALGSSGFNTLQAGFSYNGVYANESLPAACALSPTMLTSPVLSTAFTRYSCTFTTGSGVSTPTAGAYVYISQSDGIARTIYLDAVQLQAGVSASNYYDGSIQLTGIVTSPLTLQGTSNSTSAFQVQNIAGNNLLQVDTSGSNVIIGGSLGSITFNANNSSTGISCTGNGCQAKKLILTPEYSGAVLDTGSQVNDIGTMTSGFDSTRRESYYQWSTTQGSNQSYDVVVQIPLPSDYKAMVGANPLTFDINSSDITNGTVKAALWDTSGTLEGNWGYGGNIPGCSLTPGATGWGSTPTVTGCSITGTYAANGIMTLRIRLQAPTSGTTDLGNITLNYTSTL